jgi:hypothetical protein
LNHFLKPEELRRSRSTPSKLGRVKPPLRATFWSPPLHTTILGEFSSFRNPRRSKPRVERCHEEPGGWLRRAPVRATASRRRSSRCGPSNVRPTLQIRRATYPFAPFNPSHRSDLQRVVFNVSRRPVRRRRGPGPPDRRREPIPRNFL